MINLDLLREKARKADLIISGGSDPLEVAIRNGQRPQVPGGKPSRWSHIRRYMDEETVFESTIDFKPYKETGRKWDNGTQLNELKTIENCEYAYLLQYPPEITEAQRDFMCEKSRKLVGKLRYPVGGLVGTLTTIWLFPGWKSNPFQSRAAAFCSAAIQIVDELPFIGIDYDPDHTARNTSPEIIWQWPKWERTDITIGGMA